MKSDTNNNLPEQSNEDEIAEYFTKKRRKTEPWRKPEQSKVADLLDRHGVLRPNEPLAQAIESLILDGKIEEIDLILDRWGESTLEKDLEYLENRFEELKALRATKLNDISKEE